MAIQLVGAHEIWNWNVIKHIKRFSVSTQILTLNQNNKNGVIPNFTLALARWFYFTVPSRKESISHL